jgi:hypothetical protein
MDRPFSPARSPPPRVARDRASRRGWPDASARQRTCVPGQPSRPWQRLSTACRRAPAGRGNTLSRLTLADDLRGARHEHFHGPAREAGGGSAISLAWRSPSKRGATGGVSSPTGE